MDKFITSYPHLGAEIMDFQNSIRFEETGNELGKEYPFKNETNPWISTSENQNSWMPIAENLNSWIPTSEYQDFSPSKKHSTSQP